MTQTFTDALGTGTFDGNAWQWTPAPAFAEAINTDPAGLGFKSAGVFKSAAAIAKLLTDPHGTVPNPTPQPTIPKPFAILDIANAAPTTLATVADADLAPIADKINAGDVVGVKRWADILLMRKVMPQAEHDAVYAIVSATEPDPTWPATVPDVSWLEKTFGVGTVHLSLISAVTGVA